MRSRSFRSLSTVLAVCAFASAAGGQSAPDPRVDSLFATVDHPSSPGCALGVARNGKLAYERGYGSANLDYDVPLTGRSVFYLASVSKQFTAASVVIAARKGFLSLDDEIHKWLPELRDYGAPVTIRELLHHTSGVRDYFTLLSLAGIPYENVITDDQLFGLVARQRALNFAPGSEFLYSNTGYLLLAEIVERATHEPLSVFAAEHIFRPLGMHDTHFHDDATMVVKGRVIGYSRDSSGFRVDTYFNFDKVGDGGLYSTVEDLARWDEAFYSSALGAGVVDQMLERGVLTNGDTIPYALGLQHGTYRGLRTVEHGGSLAGFRTMLLRFPSERLTVVLLCNLGTLDPSVLARRVADVYLADRVPRVAAPAVAQSSTGGGGRGRSAAAGATPPAGVRITDLAGTYFSDELQASYTFAADGTTLLLQRPAGPRVALRATGDDAFTAPPGGAVIHFTRDARGRVNGFLLDAGRVRGIVFERRR